MKLFNNLKQLICLLCIITLAVACKTTVPANDTTQPSIVVSVIESGSNGALIAATDPTVTLANFTCPAGTDDAGDTKTSYITTVNNSTVDFRVTASDKGGVEYMFVNIFHNQVSNVRVLNTSGAVPQITNFSGQTRISVTFDDPKTAQILAFEVNNAGDGVVIETITRDFSNNSIGIPEINTTNPRIQVLDVSACNN